MEASGRMASSLPPPIAHLRGCCARARIAQAPLTPSLTLSACCAASLDQLAAISRDKDGESAALFRSLLMDVQEADAAFERGQSLIELLLAIAQHNGEAAQTDALLETSLRALMVVPTLELPAPRHDQLVQRALELVATLLEARQCRFISEVMRDLALRSVCDVMQRLEEDATSLVMATTVAALLVRDPSGWDATALQSSSDLVETLARVLSRTPSQRVELVQSSCELLLLLTEIPSMVQVMVSAQLIETLASVLRRSRDASQVVSTVVRLLLRMSLGAPVYGQIINEGLLPELFLVIHREVDKLQVVPPACAVLAAAMEFAVDCRLDLSVFLNTSQCNGAVLIDTAAYQVGDTELVSNTVRCLVSASSNPVDLPQLINSASIEGLLRLFMVATSTKARSLLADGLRCIILSLSRATIDAFVVKDEATTLPALFICLRSYRDDPLFVSQVFAIVTRHRNAMGRLVQSIAGYVEIAVDRIRLSLSRESPLEMAEVIELYNFLREILLSDGGNCTVNECGGAGLLSLLRKKFSEEAESATTLVDQGQDSGVALSSVARLVAVVIQLLEDSQPAALTSSSDTKDTSSAPFVVNSATHCPSSDRPGDSDYASYVASVLRSNSSQHNCRQSASNSLPELPPVSFASLSLSNEGSCHKLEEKVVASVCDVQADERERLTSSASIGSNDCEEVGDDPSDYSDSDGGEDGSENNSFTLTVEEEAALADSSDGMGLFELKDDSSDIFQAEPSSTTEASMPTPAIPSNHLHHHHLPDTLMHGSLTAFAVDQSELEDRQFCCVATNGMRFPKHPARSKRGPLTSGVRSSISRDEEDLVWTVPEYNERCTKPDPDEAAQFVADAVNRRATFDASDAGARARTVYHCVSLHELLHRRAQSASAHHHESPMTPQDSSIASQHGDSDDSDDANCPYHVPHDSHAFSSSLRESLTFDSMFESGNLARAIRVGESEYDLVLRRDLRTNGHMQWFYFAISNACTTPQPGVERQRQYRFNIINLCKPDSLFNHGLQPVVYSARDARERGVGWRRSGHDVHYFANQYLRTRVSSGSSTTSNGSTSNSTSGACYYTLTFTLELSRQDDTYLIAHSFPYTLQTHRLHVDSLLERLQPQHSVKNTNCHMPSMGQPQQQSILSRAELCKTLGGTSCELLTISEFADDSGKNRELESRRVIVITARVHPGEPQASWMMRGVIDFLVGDSDVARALRRMFIFYLVPMLNPDGVYYGNNRCSLSGCDLNRQWLDPSAETHPTIFHTKQLIAREHSSRGVVFACDLHGHSRKQNVFMYGCDTKKRPNPRARAFAHGLAAHPASFLSVPDCSFKVSKDKEATARVVLAYSLEIPWSFTLEASFCGTNLASPSDDSCDAFVGAHFTTQQYCDVGAALCEAIFTNCVTDRSVRERLCATVDDRSVHFPRIIEPFVREAALVVPGSGGSVGNKSKASSSKATGGGESKGAARAKAKRTSGSSRSLSTDGVSLQSIGAGNARKPSRTPPQASPRLMLPLRKSSSIVVPETVIPVVRAGSDSSTAQMPAPFDLLAMNSPRGRLVGKKIRVKKAKRTANRTSHDSRSAPLHRSSTEANRLESPRLSNVEESRIAIGLTASSRQSVTRIGPLSSSLTGSTLDMEPGGFGAICAPLSAGGTPLPGLGFHPSHQSRETAYVTLPTSVSATETTDPMAAVSSIGTRSPKPPASRLRFRGTGRQYAAVNSGYQPHKHRSVVLDLLRGETTANYTYDQNLLNASAISLRQRAVTSVDSSESNSCINSSIGLGTPGTSNCRLDPLTWERSVTPPRTTGAATPSWSTLP